MYKITSKWPHQDTIKIEWNLGKRCNLDCAYCPTDIHDQKSKHTDLSIIKSTIDKLKTFNKPIRISLTGGEPTVHPNINEIIEYIHKNLSWLNITTNGTRSPSWYAEQPVSHYVFSLHFDNKNWKRISENILEFSALNELNDNIPFHVHLMAHYQYIHELKQVVSNFEKENVKYTLRRIRWTTKHDWFDDMRYDAEDLKWILNKESTVFPNCIIDNKHEYHANDIIKNKMNNFKNWKCYAGIESLMINWDGDMHRATCRVGDSLGNIYNDTFTLPINPTICSREWCTCAADIPITKTSIY